MGNNHINKLLCFCDEMSEELYVIDTIVKMTKSSCLEREFNGQYYGATGDYSVHLSAERNNYINMLTILSERISHITNINISFENEILLQENTDYCRRKVTAQGSADKRS